jgi:anti-anti-sigma factor
MSVHGARESAATAEPVPLPRGSVPHGPCRTTVREPGLVLALAGRLDVSAAADVRLALVDAVTAGSGPLVVDLSGLDALDATGLGVLVGAHRRAQRAGRVLVLRDVTPAVARLLFLTRLDKVLQTTRTPALV